MTIKSARVCREYTVLPQKKLVDMSFISCLQNKDILHIDSFIAFCSHTSCNWILKHEYKRSIKLIQYIHIKYTTIRDATIG